MLRSTTPRHRASSKRVRYAALATLAGAAVAVPVLGATSASAATGSQWDQVAQCESGGNWQIDTGNGFSGGLQFTPSTWAAYGGTAYAPKASMASRDQQISVAEKVLAGQGRGAWPNCGGGLSGTPFDGGVPQAARTEQPASEQTHRQESGPAQESTRHSDRKDSARSAEQHASRGASRPTEIKKGDGDYQVMPGDSLSGIARAHHVKGGWKALFDLNKNIVGDANLIYPGQQLHLS